MTVELTLRMIDFPVPVELALRPVAVAILEKGYQAAKGSVDALARVDGATVYKFQADAAVDDMVGRKGVRSCEFTAASVYKDFQEMEKKDKKAALAFRSWALRKGAKAGKAYGDLLDTQNSKDKDPARVSALKAVNEILREYCKSF